MLDFSTLNDAMGRPTPTATVSGDRRVVALAAGQAKTVSIPTGARRVVISATDNVWVQYDRAAVLPTADDLSGLAPELNPVARIVEGLSMLGLATSGDCLVSLSFYG